MVTAITCAIRVAGDKTFRAIIGRAREPRAQAEIEVMRLAIDLCLHNLDEVFGRFLTVELLRNLSALPHPMFVNCGMVLA